MNSLSFHDNSIFCNKPKYSDAEVAQTLDTAQKHTLTVSKGVLDTAKQYTNTVSSNTLDSTYTNNKADSTLKDANNYTVLKVNRDVISGVI
ncbi:hypothetical protein, partial [Yersinia enterocolitica]